MSRFSDYAQAPPCEQEFIEREEVEDRRSERREQLDVRNADDGRVNFPDNAPCLCAHGKTEHRCARPSGQRIACMRPACECVFYVERKVA